MNSAGWYGPESGACGFSGGFNGGGYGTYTGPDAAAYGGGGGYGMPWGDNGGGAAQGMEGAGKGDFKSKGAGKSMPFAGGAGQGKGMCKFFLEGRCSRGASCAYSHGDGNAATGKLNGGGDSKGGGGGGKGKCRFFWEGKCTRGAACAYSHSAGDDDDEEPDDPAMLEIEAAIAKAQGKPHEEEEEMLAHLDEMEIEDAAGGAGTDDGGSSSGDPLPPPASEAEIEEAQRIVQKAQEELVERNKMKAKMKDCSQETLQAMINARLNRK